VELRRPARPVTGVVTRSSLLLFGSHRLTGRILVKVGAGARAEAIYVKDPVIVHPEHGRQAAQGWYRVYWNKRYAPVVVEDERVTALRRQTWD